MNQSAVVTLSWILTAISLSVVAAALYALTYAAQQRSRAIAAERALRVHDEDSAAALRACKAAAETARRDHEAALENALRAREAELEHFAVTTMPFLVESVRRSGSTVEIPIGNGDNRFEQILRGLADRYIADLRLVADEAGELARRETAAAASRAAAAAREAVENASRDATAAAVRAFGTSVVSLGADVSQVVSAALRRHHSDEIYETLVRIDHSVQQMIRQAQSYVIVCGGLPGRRWPQQSLTDVVAGAVGRVRDFTRVRLHQLDRVVISRGVEPLVHTLATLLDNALRYSPPTSFVDLTFQEGHHGVTVIVDDAGVRMNAEQTEEAREILAGERIVDIHQLGPAPRVGFPGVAALARRYGFTVYIDGPNAYGGMRAMVYVPQALFVEPSTAPPTETQTIVGQAVREPSPTSGRHAEPTPQPTAQPAVESSDSSAAEAGTTPGGLRRRQRRAMTTLTPVNGPRAEAEPARNDIATAWQKGTQSGRAAASNTEGMTS